MPPCFELSLEELAPLWQASLQKDHLLGGLRGMTGTGRHSCLPSFSVPIPVGILRSFGPEMTWTLSGLALSLLTLSAAQGSS